MVRKDRKAVQPLHEKLEDRILFDAVPDGLDQLESLLNEANSLPSELQDESPVNPCLLYTSPSPRDLSTSRMPSSA